MSCWQLKCCGRDFVEFGWCTRTPGEACGWPPKTIRSILALSVVFIAMIAAVVVIIFLAINKEWDISVGLLGAILSIATGVLGYYFGYRSGSTGFKPIESPPPPEEDDEV